MKTFITFRPITRSLFQKLKRKSTKRRVASALKQSHSPEAQCGIAPDMAEEEIRSQLALLYRRHNRLASSLVPARREEAERMLQHIVTCRLRYLKDRGSAS